MNFDHDLRWIGAVVIALGIGVGLTYLRSRNRKDTPTQSPSAPPRGTTTETSATPAQRRETLGPITKKAPVKAKQTLFVAVSYGEKLDTLSISPQQAAEWLTGGTYWWTGSQDDWKDLATRGQLDEVSDSSDFLKRDRIALVFEGNGDHTVSSRILAPSLLRRLVKEDQLRFLGAYKIGVSDPGEVGFLAD